MRLLTLHDLPLGKPHILSGIIPGDYLTRGGLNFKPPGHRSHDIGCTCDACDGEGTHIHSEDCEVFVILQGKAMIEVDGNQYPLKAGDIAICEPGEDHHLISDTEEPCVNLYLHAGDTRNPKQTGT